MAAAERRRTRTGEERQERRQSTTGGDGTGLQSAAAGVMHEDGDESAPLTPGAWLLPPRTFFPYGRWVKKPPATPI